ncbi:hypothetical protein RhiirB3_533043 [Rhizophagus irregularis]|nr:hypothetical protein RhiirB3_533043 [Rhizophagus irregularis]
MFQQHEYPTILLAKGNLSSELHYGIFARNWWFQKMPKDKKTIKNTSSQQLIVPFRLHMRVSCELNGEIFIISIVQNTTTITTLYQEIFGKRTEYSGPAIMGFYNDQIIERLLQDVTFFPIYIKIQSFLVVVSNIGYSKNNGCRGAGNGFTSSILTKFQKKHSFVSQRIENNTCILRIYHESNIVAQFEDETPTNVWKKSGINKKFDGIDLFGITHSSVQTILQNPPKNNILRICTVDEWNNFEILQQAFDRHIKSRKTGKTALLDNWQSLFIDWLSQKSTIIQIPKALQNIYPVDYQIHHKETEYSGPAIMGFYNDQIIERLLQDVTFFPIYIKIQSFLVVVSNIGYSKNNGCRGAGNGFTSSILTKFQKKHSFVSQRIENNTCILRIYHESNIVAQFEDETPTNVWKKSGINKKFDGIDLFGITHSSVQTILQNPPKNNILRICTVDEWNNFEILQQAFDRHIKSRKTGKTALLDNWQSLFIDWLSQKSTIIQIPKALQNIYPVDYQIHHKELCAWKAMLIACGCTNVTPFEKKESNIEFWSRAMDPSADKETLLNLYNAGLICLKNNTPIIIDKSMNFWESFKSTLDNNRRDIDGKIRILSIIAENFRYNDLRRKLQV